MKRIYTTLAAAALVIMTTTCAACGNARTSASTTHTDTVAIAGPEFCADSAFDFTAKQCSFGPRVMNTDAHDRCGRWIADKFNSYGLKVQLQRADLKAYDGTVLHACNIIARHNPEAERRILICAHWDSRPWADNDPNPDNHRTPVLGANDGASGVAVMLEIARLLQTDSISHLGIDFVCFDAEDWGAPQWEKANIENDSWALGSEYWATHLPDNYQPMYGILLDMVGGRDATFYQEGISKMYAQDVLNKVWSAAHDIGYGSMFPMDEGGMVTDDHLPINEKAGIPTIDIVPYDPDNVLSTFGSTWHTVYDDMEHIDLNTLKAVGQTVLQVIYTEPEQ